MGNARNYGGCDRPTGHGDHLCRLMEQGKTGEIAEKTRHPAFSCANCGARADQEEDLCNPQPLVKS